jgi:hypothetical protein
MHEHYERVHFRVHRGRWPGVIEHIGARGAEVVERNGGRIFGLWRAHIGLPFEDGVLTLQCADAATPLGALALEGAEVDLSTSERLLATERPAEPDTPKRSGIFIHRFYDVAEADWDEFYAMSVESWPRLTESFGSEVIAFWRCLDVRPPQARAHTITWYESFAAWETSRGVAARGRSAELIRHLMARQELVTSTLAFAMALIPLQGSETSGAAVP